MDPQPARTAALPPILDGYLPLPGVSDELLDPEGRIRPVWRSLIRHLDGLAPAEVAVRYARGDQYLRDAGVFFRQYDAGSSTERAWPLSHVPVLIRESEWNDIAEGLMQRADLLEAIMADLYGPNRLAAEGHLPPGLIAGNPEWLRPMVGVAPRGGNYLHFLAFEIGRGPDGSWWVLNDRTQAPSGAGFALENRMATARMYSDIYKQAKVHRLAGFFRTFRDALEGLRGPGDGPVGILTPGPLNETYFEQAYIARYLGFSLVQGEDLTVIRGQLMLRTVDGPRPMPVLWRRLDGTYADPLELDTGSRLGTPGMLGALRQGSFTMVNALGSGVLESRAFLAFMPRLARALLGEPLLLPNIATWWCGQEAERAHVAANLDRLVLSRVLRPGGDPSPVPVGAPRGRAAADWLAAEGAGLVAQEAVTLSTTPSDVEGALRPRPLSLRVFLARTAQGWQVMPGGFARIGRTPDPAAVAMQRGGASADVWIVSTNPVDAVTTLTPTSGLYRRPRQGDLPTRAADNLFWLGRYVERTEGKMRLLRAYNLRLADSGDPEAPLLVAVGPLFEALNLDPAEGIPAGLIESLGAAVHSAGQVRDRFSPDGWSALADLDKTARRMAERVTPGDDAARAVGALLRKLTGFSGLVHENMVRSTDWRFLELGRFLERAMAMSDLLATLADPEAPDGALDLAVEVGDSVMTHRRRFTIETTRATVIDLLALDNTNPRAILFQIEGIRTQIGFLPDERDGDMSDLARAVLRCHTSLATERPEGLTSAELRGMETKLARISELLTASYLR